MLKSMQDFLDKKITILNDISATDLIVNLSISLALINLRLIIYSLSVIPYFSKNILSFLVSILLFLIKSQLDKEKGVVNSELTMYDDDNFSTLFGVAMKQLFQIKSTSGDLTSGRVENINGITKDDVVSYYNQNYTPDKMITVLTGNFNPDEAIELISKNFTKPLTVQKSQLHEELKPIEQSKRIDYSTSKINTDEFAIALKGPENNNLKDILAVEILLNILSGRKHSPLRKNLEKYNVINPMVSVDEIGNKQNSPQMISIAGQSNPKDTEKVLETVYKSIHGLKFSDLTEDLNVSKKGYIKDFLTLAESSTKINSFLGTLNNEKYIMEQIIYPTLGLTGEAGEVADKVKKVIRDNNDEFTDERKRQIALELGDVLWYAASLAYDLGYTLDEVAQMNLDKLASRMQRDKIHGSGDER